jgi:siderophore-iron reductase FhuF
LPQLLEINELEKVFAPYRDRMTGYNYWIQPDNDLEKAATEGEVIPATQLLDPYFLKNLLGEWDRTLGSNNLKVAGALWSKYYCLTAFPLVVGAMSLGGIGLDLTLARTRVVLSRDALPKPMDGKGRPVRLIFEDCPAVVYAPRCGTPEVAARALPVESLAELHQQVGRAFFKEHFGPLFEAFQATTGVSPKVLWGNLSYGIYLFWEYLCENLGCEVAWREDAPAFFDTLEDAAIAAGPNPLYRPARQRPLEFIEKPGPAQIRTSCCLWYKVPGAEKCGPCPLLWPVNRENSRRAVA